MSKMRHYLEPYRSQMVDDGHEELAVQLLEWCEPRCSCARPFESHVANAYFSTAYTECCIQRDATSLERLLLAIEVMLFFEADDASHHQLAAFARHLAGTGPAETNELICWYEAFLDEMHKLAMNTADYQLAMEGMCGGMLDEETVTSSCLTHDEYFRLRRRTIAIAPYIACWIALRHRDLVGPAARVWSELNVFEVAIDAMALVNDIGSIERDVSSSYSGSHETNYVLIHHPDLPTHESRILATIALANRTVKKAQNRLLLAEDAAIVLSSPRLLEYIDFTGCLINGNRRAVACLASRYPRAAERLQQIEDILPCRLAAIRSMP